MIVIISSSPNTDGLTAACVTAALQGCAEAGVPTTHLDLCKLKIKRCQQCGNGWGQCRSEHTCILEDDLRTLQAAIGKASGVIIVTPVYWGEFSESAKCTFDRLRRCEATKGEESVLKDLPVIAVAAAGGSGGGIASCLAQMERYVQHMRGKVADLIGITRRNRPYTLDHIRAAALALASEVAITV